MHAHTHARTHTYTHTHTHTLRLYTKQLIKYIDDNIFQLKVEIEFPPCSEAGRGRSRWQKLENCLQDSDSHGDSAGNDNTAAFLLGQTALTASNPELQQLMAIIRKTLAFTTQQHRDKHKTEQYLKRALFYCRLFKSMLQWIKTGRFLWKISTCKSLSSIIIETVYNCKSEVSCASNRP